ncbi:MAG: hypothetical protein J7L52_07620 [Thermotogae bacterium]|nr:hypothetical protein [Thermotogota bacterium]
MGKLYSRLPDKSFIKRALEGEDEELVEQLLESRLLYEQETSKETRLQHRKRMEDLFWRIHRNIMLKMDESTSVYKRLLVRYNILDMRYLTLEHQKMIKDAAFKKSTDLPIYYIDEWIIEIKKGSITPSTTDEVAELLESQKPSQIGEEYKRKKGTFEAELSNLENKIRRRNLLEEQTENFLQQLKTHRTITGLELEGPYTNNQRKVIGELIKTLKELERVDRDLETQMKITLKLKEECERLEQRIRKIEAKAGKNGDVSILKGGNEAKIVKSEYNAVRQMIKMCVGRQGNHFPVLMSPLLQEPSEPYNFRENVARYLEEIENIDYELFKRVSRKVERKIWPFVILTPGYGNIGICWEPYDKYNRATGRGRIAIPIFCKEPKLAVITALGDFRWQMAKEVAAQHWMEEGLTGDIYEYYTKNKLKGNVKDHFIDFYVLWITKEAQGIQKLPKEIRNIFWRKIPFPRKLKEELSKLGYYYKELYDKDKRREKSGL